MNPPAIDPPPYRRILYGAIAMALVALFCALSLQRIWSADLWWQCRTGRLVSESGPPQADPFSFTRTAAAWIEPRWLYCLGLYRLVRLAGYPAATIAKSLILAAAFLLALLAAPRPRPLLPAAAVLLTSLLCASQRFVVRPEILTFLFIAAYMCILDRHRRRPGRLIFLIPILQIVWTNSHTLFILGPFIVACFLVDRALAARRAGDDSTHSSTPSRAARLTPLLVFALSLVGCFVNPYGLRGALFPFALFSEIHGTAFKQGISEFLSPFSFTQPFLAVTAFEVLLVVCLASAAINRRNLDPFWTLLCAAQAYLAATAIRNLPLFSLAAIPFILSNLHRSASWNALVSRAGAIRIRPLLTVLLIAAAAIYTWDFATSRANLRQHALTQPGLGLAHHVYPESAVEFIQQNALPQPIFASLADSAVLLANDIPVFMDPRLEVYGEQHFQRYQKIVSLDEPWRNAADEFGFQTALINHASNALIEEILKSPGWRLLYFDEIAVVMCRIPPPGLAPITSRDAIESRLTALRKTLPRAAAYESLGLFDQAVSAAPYVNLANLLILLNQTQLAEPFIIDALAADPRQIGVRIQYATILGNRADWPAVQRESRRLLEYDPENARGLRILANSLLQSGQVPEARELLERSASHDDKDDTTWALLGRIAVMEGDSARAFECMTRAVTLDPARAVYHKNLGKIHAIRRELNEAVAEYQTAATLEPEDVEVFQDLIALLVHLKRLDSATSVMAAALSRHPNDQKLLELDQRIQSLNGG